MTFKEDWHLKSNLCLSVKSLREKKATRIYLVSGFVYSTAQIAHSRLKRLNCIGELLIVVFQLLVYVLLVCFSILNDFQFTKQNAIRLFMSQNVETFVLFRHLWFSQIGVHVHHFAVRSNSSLRSVSLLIRHFSHCSPFRIKST
jgi:hypothetical protein